VRLYALDLFPNQILLHFFSQSRLAPSIRALVLVDVLLAAIGLVVVLRRKPTILDVYGVLYLGLLSVFAFTGARYLLPIVPILLFWAYEGARAIARLVVGETANRFAPRAVILGLLAIPTLVTLEENAWLLRFEVAQEKRKEAGVEAPNPAGWNSFQKA